MEWMLLEIAHTEREMAAQIERLELRVRETRRKVEHAHTPADKRVLNKQLGELIDEIQYLRRRLRS
jgi:TATA-binding protein-associated factor Taf7